MRSIISMFPASSARPPSLYMYWFFCNIGYSSLSLSLSLSLFPMNPFEHSLCSDHLTPSESSHGRFDLHMFLPVYEPPPFPCAIFSNPLQEEKYHDFDLPHAQDADEHFLSIGSSWQHSSRPSSSPLIPISKDGEDRKKKNSTVTSRESVPSSMKSGSPHWLSSKVKMVRKVMKPDRITSSNPGEAMLQVQDPQQSMTDGDSSNKNGQLSCSGGLIRVCSDCNTTKTPLWRSGPSGPKSLCNACGIRRRKARGAMAAAAGLTPAVGPSKLRKEKMSEGHSTMPFKKRCKFTSAQTSKQLHFDDFALDLSKNPGLQRVFPQDEKEAAMLLMGLSCGLIRG